MSTTIKIDNNGDLILESPDFSTDPNANPDDELNKWKEENNINGEDLANSDAIDSVDFIPGESVYLDSDGTNSNEGNYLNVSGDEQNESKYGSNSSYMSGKVTQDSLDSNDPYNYDYDINYKIDNPGYIRIKLSDSAKEILNSVMTSDDVIAALEGENIDPGDIETLENFFINSDEEITVLKYLKEYISYFSNPINAERTGLYEAATILILKKFGYEGTICTSNDFINAFDSAIGPISLLLIVVSIFFPEAVIAVAILSIIDLLIADEVEGTVDFNYTSYGNGNAEVTSVKTSVNSNGDEVSTVNTINFNFNDTSNTINGLLSLADLSRENLLLELNRLSLKRNINIKTASNSLHTMIYDKVEANYGNMAFSKSLLDEVEELYGLTLPYKSTFVKPHSNYILYYNSKPLTYYQASLLVDGSIYIDTLEVESENDFGSLNIGEYSDEVVSINSRSYYTSVIHLGNFKSIGYLEFDNFEKLSMINLRNLCLDKMTESYDNKKLYATVLSKANEDDVKINGAASYSNYDAYMGASEDGVIDTSINLLNTLFNNLAENLMLVCSAVEQLSEEDQAIANNINAAAGNWTANDKSEGPSEPM